MSPSRHRTEAGIGLSVCMSPYRVEWAGAGMASPRAGVWPMWQDNNELDDEIRYHFGPHSEGCELLAGLRESGG